MTKGRHEERRIGDEPEKKPFSALHFLQCKALFTWLAGPKAARNAFKEICLSTQR
jgi:hypothetical protein